MASRGLSHGGYLLHCAVPSWRKSRVPQALIPASARHCKDSNVQQLTCWLQKVQFSSWICQKSLRALALVSGELLSPQKAPRL